MTLRIAMTGATGFAGGPMAKALLAEGHKVKALARDPMRLASMPFLYRVRGDLDDEAALAHLVKDTDVVLHVAGSIAARDRQEYFDVNCFGTMRLLAAAKAAGVKRFVYISSITAREPGISNYAASKAEAEKQLLAHADGMEVLILRPPAIYGPADKSTLPLMRALISRYGFVPGRKSSKFSLIHVDDLANLVALAVRNHETGLRELHDGIPAHSWQELQRLAQAAGSKNRRLIFLPKHFVMAAALGSEFVGVLKGTAPVFNRGKVKELYHADWTAHDSAPARNNTISLNIGLPSTLSWYQKAGWIPELTPIHMRTDQRAGQ